MTSFDARLRMPGQSRLPVNVVVDVSGERLKLNRGEHIIASWRIGDIEVESRVDGFHLEFEGEQVVLAVTDPVGFAGELARAGTAPTVRVDDMQDEARQPSPSPEGLFSRVSGLDPEELVADVKRRIEELRRDLVDDSIEPQYVFSRWMKLLKEINRRHGQGAMPTPIFYRLNTELLDLLPLPPAPRQSRREVTAPATT